VRTEWLQNAKNRLSQVQGSQERMERKSAPREPERTQKRRKTKQETIIKLHGCTRKRKKQECKCWVVVLVGDRKREKQKTDEGKRNKKKSESPEGKIGRMCQVYKMMDITRERRQRWM